MKKQKILNNKMDEKKDAEEKIQQLGLMQQNIEMYNMQKQQFENQRLEAESALNEIESSKECFKIVGNIMIASKNDDLKKELTEKIDTLNIRIKSVEKQEEKLKSKANELQKDVLSKIREDKE